MLPHPPGICAFSENSWLIQFHTGIDVEANGLVHHLANQFRQQRTVAFEEIIPAYDSLYLQSSWASLVKLGVANYQKAIEKTVTHFWESLKPVNVVESENEINVEIPVCYDTRLENDLVEMSTATGLPVEEIISLHVLPVYQVFLLGFLPGFAYLGTVAEQIALPRKQQPRPIKAGAVGIAGMQTGIYPINSPGGWNIVGYTPMRLFDAGNKNPTLLQPGMKVHFRSISYSTYQKMLLP